MLSVHLYLIHEELWEDDVPWVGGAVTGTGKKLEPGLSFSYFGAERDFPGSPGLGEPNGGGQGRTPSRGHGSAKERAVRGDGGAQAWDRGLG